MISIINSSKSSIIEIIFLLPYNSELTLIFPNHAAKIHFCSSSLLDRLGRFQLLNEYIKTRRDEIVQHNSALGITEDDTISGRQMTNVGTFRAYVMAYLKSNPNIHTDMTFLIRQLQPGPTGVPIEIYVFSNDQVWANYESIQADIFDHLLAVVPEFDLRVYQEPSGWDLQLIAEQLDR